MPRTKKIKRLTKNSTNPFTHTEVVKTYLQNIELMKNWISSNLAYIILYHHQEFIKPMFLVLINCPDQHLENMEF